MDPHDLPELDKDLRQRDNILDFHRLLCAKARDLMERKSNDYAGEDGANTFRNFELCDFLGVTETDRGIMVRLTDKVSRLGSFFANDQMLVSDESFEDTVLDLINYSVLLIAWRKSSRS